jgi:Tripartite ATP-independent periplasmic transporter, DctM component
MDGSLYLAVVLTATIFAMATGIVGAAVTVLGIMTAPMMIKTGYDARLSAGAIAAGGTLGILIPPSIMLVVMGPVMGVPVNLLYSAAFGPGFLLAGCYIAYTLFRSGQTRPADLVRCADRRQHADLIFESAGCHVGLLPAQRRSAVEPRDDLQGNGRLHGHPGDRPGPAVVVPADRAVAMKDTARLLQGRRRVTTGALNGLCRD